MHALIGAYKKEGYEWVDELCQVLGENIDYASEHIINNYHGIKFLNRKEPICCILTARSG